MNTRFAQVGPTPGQPILIVELAGLERNGINVVMEYQRGLHNRIEYARFVIRDGHIGNGTSTNDAAREYARRLGRPTDDAGHILASNLGGSGSDVNNIFPQDANINRGHFSQMEGTVCNIVRTHGYATYQMRFSYNNPLETTRPSSITFAYGHPACSETINDLVNESNEHNTVYLSTE